MLDKLVPTQVGTDVIYSYLSGTYGALDLELEVQSTYLLNEKRGQEYHYCRVFQSF